jgi:hypothetical protein
VLVSKLLPGLAVSEAMLFGNERLDLGSVPMPLCPHRPRHDTIVEEDLRDVHKLPAMLHCTNPEVPVLETGNRHCRVIASIGFPDTAAIDGACIDVVPIKETVPAKATDMPAPCSFAEVFGITVYHANLRVGAEGAESVLDVARPDPVVRVER